MKTRIVVHEMFYLATFIRLGSTLTPRNRKIVNVYGAGLFLVHNQTVYHITKTRKTHIHCYCVIFKLVRHGKLFNLFLIFLIIGCSANIIQSNAS